MNRLWKQRPQTPQQARGDLTNGPTWYSFMVTENNKVNCARCWNTSHSSNPTLVIAVNGLLRIIQNRGTLVLRGFGGPTDKHCVRVGRFAVPGMEEV